MSHLEWHRTRKGNQLFSEVCGGGYVYFVRSCQITFPVLKFLPFSTHQAKLTASYVEGCPRCQCASDQRACYKCIHTPWSLCYQANYITAKCLVRQTGEVVLWTHTSPWIILSSHHCGGAAQVIVQELF